MVRFEEKRDGEVHLEYEMITNRNQEFIHHIKKLYDQHRDFLSVCKKLSFEYDLVQDAGGNVSYKFRNKMIITSSGRKMSDVTMLNGYTVCDIQEEFPRTIANEEDYTSQILSLKSDEEQERPSMETGLHVQLSDKVVIHTHPIHLNTILCSKESRDIIPQILAKYDYDYNTYLSPGKILNNNLQTTKGNKIILLENHGLVCVSKNMMDAFNITVTINNICKQWLIDNSQTFKTFVETNMEEDGFLFPDAVVLTNKTRQINDYILQLQKEVGLTPRFLDREEVNLLKSMESEKYRTNLQ